VNTAARLAEYLGRRHAFDWATANCCHFAAGWVTEVEGADAMSGIATPTVRSAVSLVRAFGGLSAAITRRLGREPIAPTLARVGDVVLMDGLGPCGAMVGICAGRTAVFVTEHGDIAHQPMSEAAHAWRVGL
jgi:hypothetical protein